MMELEWRGLVLTGTPTLATARPTTQTNRPHVSGRDGRFNWGSSTVLSAHQTCVVRPERQPVGLRGECSNHAKAIAVTQSPHALGMVEIAVRVIPRSRGGDSRAPVRAVC
jgi:hypothetical protein